MMKFNRGRLHQAIVTAIEADRTAHEKKYQQTVEQYEKKLDEWHRAHGAAWLAFFEEAAHKIKSGLPFRYEDMPTARPQYSRSVATFEHSEPKKTEWRAPAELSQLLAVIDALDEDTISLYALKQLGFGQGAMARVSTYLVAP